NNLPVAAYSQPGLRPVWKRYEALPVLNRPPSAPHLKLNLPGQICAMLFSQGTLIFHPCKPSLVSIYMQAKPVIDNPSNMGSKLVGIQMLDQITLDAQLITFLSVSSFVG